METIAVVTDENKAVNKLNEWFNNFMNEANIFCRWVIEPIESECSCGDCQAKVGYFEKDETTKPVRVLICKSCADE